MAIRRKAIPLPARPDALVHQAAPHDFVKMVADLVSRFRSSPEFAARSEANFGIERH
jgi:hypothetical protein